MGMPDREKVINKIEEEIRLGEHWNEIYRTVDLQLLNDILIMLKEQEAVALKPHYIDKYGKNFICGVECGNCGIEISATYKFCPYCGRPVKWE